MIRYCISGTFEGWNVQQFCGAKMRNVMREEDVNMCQTPSMGLGTDARLPIFRTGGFIQEGMGSFERGGDEDE